MVQSLLARIEASAVATTIQGSTTLNGVLSGIHLVGLTLLLGSVLVTSFGLAGFWGGYPMADLTRTSRRASFWGLAVSVGSGSLLVAPRIGAAVENPTFRWKMILLVVGTTWLLGLQHPAARGARRLIPPVLIAIVAVAVWSGVALAGLAFILLE